VTKDEDYIQMQLDFGGEPVRSEIQVGGTMTKKDLVDSLAKIHDNERVNIIIQNGDDEPIEDGDILEIVDQGYMSSLGHVIYVQKT